MQTNMTRPRPRCDYKTMEMLHQVEAAIRIYEAEGDLKSMILAMAEKEDLLKQAIQESSDWARRNTRKEA
jgi:hypothetical protein